MERDFELDKTQIRTDGIVKSEADDYPKNNPTGQRDHHDQGSPARDIARVSLTPVHTCSKALLCRGQLPQASHAGPFIR